MMSVEVRVRYNGKHYSIDREVENHFPGVEEDIVKFVRETLIEVIVDIAKLEGRA